MEIDLKLEAGGSGREPLYAQIAGQIRAEIWAGRLNPGERLPPIRQLARAVGVNRDTVSLAYERLAREGVVEATVGRGTFVRAGRPAAPMPSRPPPLAPMVDRLLDFERARPSFLARDGAVPLHSLTPDPSLYPVAAFRRALDRALDAGGSDLLVYGDNQGNLGLREVIAERLAEHGLLVEVDSIVPCHGASQGISLAMRLYAEPGDWIAVEEPTYHNVLGVLVALGLRPAPIPMTPDGPDLAVLESTLARPEVKLLYTMPSFHNPMGVTTSLAHRRQLLEIANRFGTPVIEDAFEMDLRYDGEAVPPLAALDTGGVVVHLFSFSKSLFPGVRVGSITAQGRAVDGLLALKHATDLSGSLILQAAVAEFVGCGAYAEHLTGLRATLRDRRDALLQALAREMPSGARWTVPDGGYQIWLELDDDVDTGALLSEARNAGVLFAPGYQFNHDGRPSSCMRLTIALASSAEIRRGVTLLGELVHAHRKRPAVSRDMSIHL